MNIVTSTFALTLAPEYDQVIRQGSQALAPGKRWVILDFKLPTNWLASLAPLLAFLTHPFGVRLEMGSRHPWESIERYLQNARLIELYGGFVYIAVGERGLHGGPAQGDCGRNEATAAQLSGAVGSADDHRDRAATGSAPP